MKGKRIISLMAAVLLSLVTCLTLMSNMTPVYADENDGSMYMGLGVLGKNANTPGAQILKFGRWSWYVIGCTDSNITLLSQGNYDHIKFNDELDAGNQYANSYLRYYIEGMAGNFYPGEEDAVIHRTLGAEDDGNSISPFDALLWPLSSEEAENVDVSLRRADPDHPDWWDSAWWLRSISDANQSLYYVSGEGVIDRGMPVNLVIGVRPAFYLDPSSVLFTSAATGGKSWGPSDPGPNAVAPVGVNTNNEWKVTLKGLAPDFDISCCAGTYDNDTSMITIKYTGAQGNYISAIVTDSTGTKIRKYGRIASASGSSGEATISTRRLLSESGDRVFVFNEQYNGDNCTDYASKLKEIQIPPTGHVWKDDNCTEAKTCTVCGATEGSPNGHSFTYTLSVDRRTITAFCSAENCPSGYNENGISVTLKAPEDFAYDGNSKEAEISGYQASVPQLESEPEITYYRSTGEGSINPDGPALDGAPKYHGSYVAQITWGGQTAAVPFTITTEKITYTVTFKVVNGAWNDGSEEDKNVELSRYEDEDLALVLSADQIPAVGNKPAENYMAGSWDTVPDTTTAITKDTTYTYTYAQKPVYNVIEGANGKVTKNSGKGLTFKTDGDYAKFTGIKIDDKNVASSLYTAKSGSTIVELKAACIDQLSVGKHTIQFLYTDGSCETTFEVQQAVTPTKTPTATPTRTPGKSNGTAAKTGDTSNTALWLLLMGAAAGFVLTLVWKRRAGRN